jgi:hypothetical protein
LFVRLCRYYLLKAVLLECSTTTAHAEWHLRVSQNEPSATISSSVIWHVDCYAREREATAPAGNEARK